MSERKTWTTMLVGGCVGAVALGGLIWHAKQNIEETRVEIEELHGKIAQSRKLLTGTNALEREVIVLRETDQAIRRILPDEEDLNNLVRDLRSFEEEAKVRITGLKTKQENRSAQQANAEQFRKVAYTLTLESDAFQLLSFFDLIESHSRFMSLPTFKITAASRRDIEAKGVAGHRVQVDVETYVYEAQTLPQPVKVEGYDRKRELLLGEINRRQDALTVGSYEYAGQRGRRDPWIDPRVPVDDDNENTLSVEEQLLLVEKLSERTKEALAKWEAVKQAGNVIEEMTERADLEEIVAEIDKEIRRIEQENAIRFIPSQRRFKTEVLDPIAKLKVDLKTTDGPVGPSVQVLAQLEESIADHLVKSEYKLALDTFRPIESKLALAERDPKRRDRVKNLRNMAYMAQTALDFDAMPIDIGGVAIMHGTTPLVLIGGHPYEEGELLSNELLIRSVRASEIEFIFRGVILIRHF